MKRAERQIEMKATRRRTNRACHSYKKYEIGWATR